METGDAGAVAAARGDVPGAAFYEPLEPGIYRGTEATAGPWSALAQHGGPPSALAAREMERHEPDDSMRLARVSVDILRPVPVGVLTLRTRTARRGKRVALLETVVQSGDQDVLVARGWRIARSDAVPVIAGGGRPPDIPTVGTPPVFDGWHADGYLTKIDWRVVSGTFGQPGPCVAWARPQIPLLPDEVPSPMSRTLLLADSGSGMSMALDPVRYLFINVDLTVVLYRDPVGQWLLMDADSAMGGTGSGLARTHLSDGAGACGMCIQTLLVAPR